MRSKRPGRHKTIPINPHDYPDWMLDENVDVFGCLYGIGEDVVMAKALADTLHASEYPASREPYNAAMKAFAQLNNERLSTRERTKAGTRAMRKFWDAKVAARRIAMRERK